MNQIEIDALNKHFGSFHALRDITLSVPDGSFVALVGPSGCGKSTLLRTIAGLEKSTSGDIRIAGSSVSGKPPRQRDVAMVFQSYALYPHMTVANNMNFSLRLRHMPRQTVEDAAKKAADTLGLSGLLDRFPRALSGGQRQRVAMGRAIVRNPKVFLFDEPLSNLDAALRVHMRSEVRKLHERLEATSVYVTHDQIEAMTMADHIVVLRAGRIEQEGKPLDLYDRPVNKFVASFIGSPAMNFVAGKAVGDGIALELDASQMIGLDRSLDENRAVLVGLRPEQLSLEETADAISLDARVDAVESTGSMTYLTAVAEPARLTVALPGRPTVKRGEAVRLYARRDDIRLFDPADETLIA